MKLDVALSHINAQLLFWSLCGLGGALNTVSWVWMYSKIPRGAYPFILHYNIYFGRDLLGTHLFLFQIPLLGLIILAINIVLATTLWEKARFFAWLVAGTTFFLQALILYASGIIIYVNS